MSNNLEYQLELAEQIRDELESVLYRLENVLETYEMYINRLESEGLLDNYVTQLRERYYATTAQVINELEDQIKDVDMPITIEFIDAIQDFIDTAYR